MGAVTNETDATLLNPHQLGEQLNQFLSFGLGKSSLALAIHPNFCVLENISVLTLLLAWHWSFAPDLRYVSTWVSRLSFVMVWASLPFVSSSSTTLALGLAMLGFVFLYEK